jgi:imidazolonepropionase-like amidohydrolase
VLVEGETIREVSDPPVKSARAAVVDLKGKTLMPGLIDAHVHAIAVEVNLAVLPILPVTLLAHQASAILEGMLRRGFTSIRDAGGADFGLAQAVEQGLIAGPRMFISGQALSQTGGHADLRARTATGLETCACCQAGAALGRIADGVSEVRKAARDELRKGASQIKIMASGGVASPNDPVWNLQYRRRGARDRRGGGRLAHLCHGPCLHAAGDPPLDQLRRALHRARQLDRCRDRPPCRRP